MVEQRRYRVRVRSYEESTSLRPEAPRETLKQWVSQLNAAHGQKLDRPVSGRFLWPGLQLELVSVDDDQSTELRPAGMTSIPNRLLFDHRVTDEDMRLYAVMKGAAISHPDGVWAVLPVPMMAALLGVGERTIQTRLNRLRDAGHISDERSHPAFGRVYKLLAG